MKKLVIAFAFLVSSAAMADYCATVYQGEHMTGASMTLYSGDRVRDLGNRTMDHYNYRSWDNAISSLKVRSGCRLVTFQYQDFNRDFRSGERVGRREVYGNRGGRGMTYVDDLYSFNNKISSLKCRCGHRRR